MLCQPEAGPGCMHRNTYGWTLRLAVGPGACADVEVDEAWLARVRAAQEQRGGGGQGGDATDDLDVEEIRAYKQR